jgi:hypothetical protein
MTTAPLQLLNTDKKRALATGEENGSRAHVHLKETNRMIHSGGKCGTIILLISVYP